MQNCFDMEQFIKLNPKLEISLTIRCYDNVVSSFGTINSVSTGKRLNGAMICKFGAGTYFNLEIFVRSNPQLEIWDVIRGYANYAVSSFGRVKNIKSGRILNPSLIGKVRNQYLAVNLSKKGFHKTIKIHKLVSQAFLSNPEKKQCVDHIDRNRLNNKASNLRRATQSENCMNKSMLKNNKSGIIGVCFNKKQNRYHVRIMVDGKNKYIGYYKTLQEAKKKRKQA